MPLFPPEHSLDILLSLDVPRMSTKLRVGWHREHFLSPLLQLAAKDNGATFELVECPGGTGEMQVKMKNDEIDVCIGKSGFPTHRLYLYRTHTLYQTLVLILRSAD